MQMLCEKLSKFSVPAVRAAVSYTLSNSYGMSQNAIAAKLGIAQPAVYKYLKGKYSKRVMMVTNYIRSSNSHKIIINAVLSGSTDTKIRELVEKVASSSEVLHVLQSYA